MNGHHIKLGRFGLEPICLRLNMEARPDIPRRPTHKQRLVYLQPQQHSSHNLSSFHTYIAPLLQEIPVNTYRERERERGKTFLTKNPPLFPSWPSFAKKLKSKKIFLLKILDTHRNKKKEVFLNRICTQLSFFAAKPKQEEDGLTWSLNQL